MIQNATVVLEMEKPPELDMKDILDKVKAQYEAMAARAREDAEQCNQQKVSLMELNRATHTRRSGTLQELTEQLLLQYQWQLTK